MRLSKRCNATPIALWLQSTGAARDEGVLGSKAVGMQPAYIVRPDRRGDHRAGDFELCAATREHKARRARLITKPQFAAGVRAAQFGKDLLQGMQIVGDGAVVAGLATSAFGEGRAMFCAWTSRPRNSSSLFMVCLLCVGSFIGDAAPAVIPHWRLGTVYSAQPATPPLRQAHRFLFRTTLHFQRGRP
jgi:hypothetical protein